MNEMAAPAEETRPAIEATIAATYPWARAFARLLTRDPVEAEDLLHDAMVQALRRPPEPPTTEVLQAWLRVVMPRLHLRRVRHAAREARAVLRLQRERSEPRLQPETTTLLSVLDALPPRRRACAVLFYLFDMPAPQIAGALGLREGTVKAHLAQARTALRSMLEQEEGTWNS